MLTAIGSYFKNYFNFSGRASRREYWYIQLFQFLMAILFSFFGFLFFFLWPLWVLFTILPSISLYVRRLHDINWSAWLLLCAFIPCVGWFLLFTFTLIPGTKGVNRYGHSDYNKLNFRNRSKSEENLFKKTHPKPRRNFQAKQRRFEEEDEWDDF